MFLGIGKKRKKVVLTIVGVLFMVVILGLFWVGNYLVTFAIGRDAKTGKVAPDSSLSDEAIMAISRKMEEERRNADEWLASSSVEEIWTQSEDGLKLKAEYVKAAEESNQWVICIHGYRKDHSVMETVAAHYGERGYNALLPDLRGSGESEGSYIGMGWLDRKDMMRWIDWIIQRDARAVIVLHGISMGGATVMMTSGEELPGQVVAMVEDCGYTSVWDIFGDEMEHLFNLPQFPILHIASLVASLRAGYGFGEASALMQVKKAKTPMLFIHGSEDNFVRADMVHPLYEACTSEKELLIMEGAGHGNSCYKNADLYFNTVFSFIDKAIIGNK